MKRPTLKEFREWGRIGGHVRAAKLTPEQLSEIGKKANAARQKKRKK